MRYTTAHELPNQSDMNNPRRERLRHRFDPLWRAFDPRPHQRSRDGNCGKKNSTAPENSSGPIDSVLGPRREAGVDRLIAPKNPHTSPRATDRANHPRQRRTRRMLFVHIVHQRAKPPRTPPTMADDERTISRCGKSTKISVTGQPIHELRHTATGQNARRTHTRRPGRAMIGQNIVLVPSRRLHRARPLWIRLSPYSTTTNAPSTRIPPPNKAEHSRCSTNRATPEWQNIRKTGERGREWRSHSSEPNACKGRAQHHTSSSAIGRQNRASSCAHAFDLIRGLVERCLDPQARAHYRTAGWGISGLDRRDSL